jgi:hypothetical protein
MVCAHPEFHPTCILAQLPGNREIAGTASVNIESQIHGEVTDTLSEILHVPAAL